MSIVGESSKKNDEAQRNMEQQPSTLLSEKRSEDQKEIEASEFLGIHKSKLRYKNSREKKKLRRDEAQQFLQKEEEKKKKRIHKRLRKRSYSKEKWEISEEKKRKKSKFKGR